MAASPYTYEDQLYIHFGGPKPAGFDQRVAASNATLPYGGEGLVTSDPRQLNPNYAGPGANTLPLTINPQGPPAGGSLSQVDYTPYVTSLYQSVLGRAPDQGGLQAWVGQLQSGKINQADLANVFANSPEGQAYSASQAPRPGYGGTAAPAAAPASSATGGSGSLPNFGGIDFTKMLSSLQDTGTGGAGGTSGFDFGSFANSLLKNIMNPTTVVPPSSGQKPTGQTPQGQPPQNPFSFGGSGLPAGYLDQIAATNAGTNALARS